MSCKAGCIGTKLKALSPKCTNSSSAKQGSHQVTKLPRRVATSRVCCLGKSDTFYRNSLYFHTHSLQAPFSHANTRRAKYRLMRLVQLPEKQASSPPPPLPPASARAERDAGESEHLGRNLIPQQPSTTSFHHPPCIANIQYSLQFNCSFLERSSLGRVAVQNVQTLGTPQAIHQRRARETTYSPSTQECRLCIRKNSKRSGTQESRITSMALRFCTSPPKTTQKILIDTNQESRPQQQ